MTVKWIGAACIIGSCCGVGFSMANAYRKEEAALQQLETALQYMLCELQYRLSPLPDLCRSVARECNGCIQLVFQNLAEELENQIAPDATVCMNEAIHKVSQIPERVKKLLKQLGIGLGRFDLEGQQKGLESVRIMCQRDLEELARNRDVRLRNYRTLGLCAGCALAILFL